MQSSYLTPLLHFLPGVTATNQMGERVSLLLESGELSEMSTLSLLKNSWLGLLSLHGGMFHVLASFFLKK